MNLLFRLSLLLFTFRRRPPVPMLGPSRTSFRCLPTDLDVFGHMNNGKFFSLLDLARIDLLLRAGVVGALRRRGWYPVIAAETIRFRRSLTNRQRFAVDSEVIGWDDRTFFVRQQVSRNENTVAEALIRIAFRRQKKGTVSPRELLQELGATAASPALPDWVASWKEEIDRHRD